MGEFLGTALGFPTALFSFLLLVVVVYWVAVAVGGADLELLDGDDGHLAESGLGLGLGGVPVTVTLSLLIAFGWFISLAGSALVDGFPLRAAVLIIALAGAWLGTRLLVRPLRRLMPDDRGPSRADFVGRMCVIRTGSVSDTFGQAEVTAPDGSSALIQVRQNGRDALGAGSTALIFQYDADGEFFWVMPYDAALDPHRSST